MTAEWQSTACILCECNCGIVVQVEDRRLARIRGDKAHPGVAGLHLQQGVAAGPLPEQPRPPDLAAAPPRRRDLRGDRLGHRDCRDRRGVQAHPRHLRRGQDLLLRRRWAGQPPGRGLQRRIPEGPGSALPVKCAGAGEDRRSVGRCAPVRRSHPRRVRARRGVGVRREEPVDVAELSPGPGGAQRDRQGPGPVDDRDRSRRHRHREDVRLPPAGAARHRRLVPGRAGRRPGPGKPLRRSISRRARARRRRPCAPRCARCRSPTTRSAAGSTRSCCGRRRGASAPPPASRCSRTSGFSRHPTARCAPT